VQALLLRQSDADAKGVLDALAPALKEASVEQQALAKLAAARLALRANNPRVATAALAQAATLAQRSGVRQLQLQVALERTPDDATLDAQTRALGNAPLRLQYLERAMRAALARRDRAAAAAAYREALGWLRNGDYAYAADLHALGAQALDGEAATIARERSEAARATLAATTGKEAGQ